MGRRRQILNQLDPCNSNGVLNFVAAFYSQCQELTFSIKIEIQLIHSTASSATLQFNISIYFFHLFGTLYLVNL